MDQGDAVPIAELWEERRYLLDVAHWMLGDPGTAEVVVDEANRRWYGLSGAARGQIAAPRSWLAKTVGGICLGRLALPGRDTADHEAGHEAGHGRASKQELTARTRQLVQSRRTRFTPPHQHDTVVRAVHRAWLTEDGELLTSLLCPDGTAFFDGGGKIRAPTGPLHGSGPVADSLLTLLARRPHTTLTIHSVNGRTGLVARYGRQVTAVISLDVAHDRVALLWVMLNPDKLRPWNRHEDGDGLVEIAGPGGGRFGIHDPVASDGAPLHPLHRPGPTGACDRTGPCFFTDVSATSRGPPRRRRSSPE